MAVIEKTLFILKPECFESMRLPGGNNLSAPMRASQIITEIGDLGNPMNFWMGSADREKMETHYAEHKGKDFYPDLIERMTRGKIWVGILEGSNVVARLRDKLGNADPKKAAPGTLRAKYGTDLRHNAIHASDSVEAAEREIGIWFPSQPEMGPKGVVGTEMGLN